MIKLIKYFALLAVFINATASVEWFYYKHYPWVYDYNTKEWLYLKAGNDRKIYSYRNSTRRWVIFDYPNKEDTWHEEYELWARYPSQFGGLKSLNTIYEAKENKSTHISLNSSYITNISPLSTLSSIVYLDLADNNITDISPLTNLVNLEELYLDRNNITNISQISSLRNLRKLSISSNNITDISALGYLENLTNLSLGYNAISNLAALSNFKKLITLQLQGNQIHDLNNLFGLTKLENLDLQENIISNSQKSLLEQALPNTLILWPKDIDTLWNQKFLEWNKNPKKFGGVSTLEKIKEAKDNNETKLILSSNNIIDISPLAGLTNIKYVKIEGDSNQFSDLSPLAPLKEISELTLVSSNISDLTPIAHLLNLRKLTIKSISLSDLSPLSNIKNLESLTIENSNSLNLPTLRNHQNFQEINLINVNLQQQDFTSPDLSKSSTHGIPVISISTEDFNPITSRDDYSRAIFKLYSENENIELEIKIRGRGHSSWNFPKKSYQIKFDEKEGILNMPKDKKWVLLANYCDKTLLRNKVAYDLGRFSRLDWTPESRFVELFLNSEYLGIYQIGQKVEESANRVDIGKDGFLLEIDQKSRLDPDDVYFENNDYFFNIKEPDVEFNDNRFRTIKDFIIKFENTLLNENFTDPKKGYTNFIDISSFVDWYLINEITKNNDAKFYSSVYLNYIPGGKLKMGPLWDFDIALGNINFNGNQNVDGFWIKGAKWYSRLFEDPNFVDKVKVRFNEFYNHQNIFYENIDSDTKILFNATSRNFNKWPILGAYVWPNDVVYSTYQEEVNYLKIWLSLRLDWLKTSFDQI